MNWRCQAHLTALGTFLPLADCEIMTLIFGRGILLLTLPGAQVWLASRKKDAVKTSNRRRSPSGATFRARWLREVGGAGNNFGGGPLSSCRCNGRAFGRPSAGVQR